MQGRKITQEEQAKIISAKVVNPDLSIRDIADSTWIAKSTVANTINDTPEILESLDSKDKAESILNTMDEIISEIADITRLAINPIRDKVIEWTLTVGDLKQLNDIAKNNFDRKQILTGKPTDITKHEWLSTLSTEELLKITNW